MREMAQGGKVLAASLPAGVQSRDSHDRRKELIPTSHPLCACPGTCAAVHTPEQMSIRKNKMNKIKC